MNLSALATDADGSRLSAAATAEPRMPRISADLLGSLPSNPRAPLHRTCRGAVDSSTTRSVHIRGDPWFAVLRVLRGSAAPRETAEHRGRAPSADSRVYAACASPFPSTTPRA